MVKAPIQFPRPTEVLNALDELELAVRAVGSRWNDGISAAVRAELLALPELAQALDVLHRAHRR